MHVLVEIEGSDDDDYQWVVDLGAGELAGGLDTVHLGHAYVEQANVRAQLARECHCFAAIGGLADDLDVRLSVQDHRAADMVGAGRASPRGPGLAPGRARGRRRSSAHAAVATHPSPGSGRGCIRRPRDRRRREDPRKQRERTVVERLGVILVWLIITPVADPTGAVEVVAGYGFFLFSAALGASIRFYANARIRDIQRAKLRQRNQLARELHDTIGHHVSAIAIQAQAGRTLAASNPDRAVKALEIIEKAASRALEEMRAMVGVLRDGAEADLAPQPGVADIEHLARHVDGLPSVEVKLSGDLDELSPAVEVALYRIAQESVTNAVRHARDATRITVDVVDEGEQVRLIVRDDGDAATTAHGSPGYGLVRCAVKSLRH